jgi:demethylmenaquinone methyltransferase/2-methoxy-6-polyprenyl-1,4-benzoquinol methylase
MFGRISRRYDRLNSIMSGGRHHAWRRMATDAAVDGAIGPALDVATGTGDFALELARRTEVTGVVGLDFTPEMLPIALDKTRDRHMGDRAGYAVADAHRLPLPDDHFICATVGFGVRNFVDLTQALSEMVRVLRPGGRLVILEIVRQDGLGIVGKVFPLYFRYVTPWIGAVFGGNREAYTYLPESVQGFLSAGELSGMMRRAGLQEVRHRKLAFGTVAIHVGVKAKSAGRPESPTAP